MMKFTKVYYKTKEGASQKRITVNQGGTSSSKTWSILQLLYILADKSKKGVLISIVSESMPHLKRGCMRDFFTMLKELGLYIRDNHNKTDHSYQIGNSTIEFFSSDNEAKLRGARRDILYINECNNVSYEAYNQLEVRTKKKVFLDFNPVSEFWVHDKVLPHDDSYFIKSTYLDNDQLDEQIIKSIEKRKYTDPMWWNVYGLGNVGTLEGVIFPAFEVVDSMPEDVKWTVCGLDFGYSNDPTAFIEVAFKEDQLYFNQVLFETGLTNDDIVAKLQNLGIKRMSEIYADSAEPKSIEEIRRKGYKLIKPTVKGKDSIMNGITLLKQYKLNITKSSVDLIKEFRNYQWFKDKDGKHHNKPVDSWNHGIDAVRYAASMKLTKPTSTWASRMRK